MRAVYAARGGRPTRERVRSPPRMKSASSPASKSPAIASSGIVLRPELPVCQTDLPLDWY